MPSCDHRRGHAARRCRPCRRAPLRTCVRRRRVADDRDRVAARRPGSAGRATSSPTTESGVAAERLRVGQAVGVELDDADRQHGRARARWSTQTSRGAAGDAVADPRPQPRVVGSAEPYGGRTGQNSQRPTDHQQGRQQRDHHRQRRPATPIAATGPRLRVELVSANSRHSMPMTTVRAAGDDRRPGPAQRDRHRLVPVRVPAQLLAVAGDQQQGVVGAGAEHQHGEDAGALRVDDQAGVLGQQVDDAPGRPSARRPPRCTGSSHSTGLR